MASAALQWMCIRKNNSFLVKGPVGSSYSFSKARIKMNSLAPRHHIIFEYTVVRSAV